MKILVVFTGGTIGCVRKGEVLSPDNEQKYMLTQMYLDRYGDVDFDTAEPYTVLSADRTHKLRFPAGAGYGEVG
jgi:L-asparaginase